jgi:putative component of toxin-antitoxin plasmid stabilization module
MTARLRAYSRSFDIYRNHAIFCHGNRMPHTRLLFFQDAEGFSPAWEWLKELRTRNPKAYAKCAVRIRRLAEMGHELRRPEADLLRDGIYELRARLGTVNYRILYFFHGRDVAVLANAITKENEIPATDINRALVRKKVFMANPGAHTFSGDIEHA